MNDSLINIYYMKYSLVLISSNEVRISTNESLITNSYKY